MSFDSRLVVLTGNDGPFALSLVPVDVGNPAFSASVTVLLEEGELDPEPEPLEDELGREEEEEDEDDLDELEEEDEGFGSGAGAGAGGAVEPAGESVAMASSRR